MINDVTATKIKNFLNSYLFDKVWNEPYSEYRQNYIPRLLSTTPVVGTYSYLDEYVSMPSVSTCYYLYALPASLLAPITITAPEWQTISEYVADKQIMFRVHGTTGEMLYRDKIYFINNVDNSLTYMAVEKNMYDKILGKTYSPRNIFVATYFDSDIENPLTLQCFNPKTQAELLAATTAAASGNLIFVNGYESYNVSSSVLSLGDYIEVIKDRNIYCEFTLDLTNIDDNRFFTSTKDSCIKQLIHIPKALNPNQKVITHNTCDMYIRPNIGVNKNIKGRFLHRCQMGVDIGQVTFNDFSIPMYIIDAYTAAMNVDEISIRVVCRVHDKNNVLIRDKDYVDYLYTHSDAEILQFLEGVHEYTASMQFWKAENLEKSKYTEMMTTSVPQYIDVGSVTEYIDVLGYNNTLALVCARVLRKVIPENLSHTMHMAIPVLFESAKLYAFVYIDGIKIHNDYVTVSTSSLSGYIDVTLSPSIELPVGKDLVVELFENQTRHTMVLEPTEDTPSFVIPYIGKTYLIYEVNNMGSVTVKGVDRTANTSYIPRTLAEVGEAETDDAGVQTLTFKNTSYGNTYVLQNTVGIYRFTADIGEIADANGSIVVNTNILVDDTVSTTVPLLGTTLCPFVFLNGKLLADGVDYKLRTIKDSSNNPAFSQVVVQNINYIKSSGNTLEVYLSRDSIAEAHIGFMTSNVITGIGDVMLWFDETSMLSVDGKVVKDVEVATGQVSISESYGQRVGAVYDIKTIFCNQAVEFANQYSTDTDTTRLQVLRDYFSRYDTTTSGTIVLPYSHKIYSVFLNNIIRDVLAGTKVIGYEPDLTKVLNQVSEYFYLRDLDIVYTESLDIRFVDYHPSYQKLLVEGTPLYRALYQLKTAALVADTIVDEDAV